MFSSTSFAWPLVLISPLPDDVGKALIIFVNLPMLNEMKTRPWPLIILAVIHICAPFANIFLSASLLKMNSSEYLSHLWYEHSLWDLASFFIPIPIAGVAIWAVKKWSYPVFILVMAWVTYSNYQEWKLSPTIVTNPILFFLCIINFTIVSYFLIPQVRATYFKRFLRWWEIAPRYSVNAPCTIFEEGGGNAIKCKIENMSIVGALVSTTQNLNVGALCKFEFSYDDLKYEISAKIVRRTHIGFGISFVHTKKTVKIFRSLIADFNDDGVPCPSRVLAEEERLAGWMKRLLKTGKGLLPEPKFESAKNESVSSDLASKKSQKDAG